MFKKMSYPLLALLCSCSSNKTPEIPLLTYAELIGFEDLAQSKNHNIQNNELSVETYAQPKNKKVECKVPASKNNMILDNFKQYWDGECKNGFAYGLGRDIEIANNFHIEVITFYDHNDKSKNIQALYDLNRKMVGYSKGNTFAYIEELVDPSADTSFDIKYTYIYKEKNNLKIHKKTEFSPYEDFTKISDNVLYKFNVVRQPFSSLSPNMPFIEGQIADQVNKKIGIQVAKYMNGTSRGILTYKNNKLGNLPEEYVTHINNTLSDINSIDDYVISEIKLAKQYEVDYLYGFCNKGKKIGSLSIDESNSICTYKGSYSSKFNDAHHRYMQKINETQELILQRQNEESERQRSIAIQNAYNQKQRSAELASQLQQLGQQLQNAAAAQQILNSYQAPQVNQITQPKSNKITCVQAGIVTSCK